MLHVELLGLRDCILKYMELVFTPGAINLISHVTGGIYEYSRGQNIRDVPDSNPFRHGLMSMKFLKVKNNSK